MIQAVALGIAVDKLDLMTGPATFGGATFGGAIFRLRLPEAAPAART